MESLNFGEFTAIRYEISDGTQIVALRGEVDLFSAHRLRELISRAKNQAGEDAPRVVVDLSRVEFMDMTGFRVLVEERSTSREFGGRMCLVAPGVAVRRLLEVTGLDELFDLYTELDAAMESCALTPA